MRTAAQFLREITHPDHADGLTVLFVEQRRRAALLGILQRHDLGDDRDRFAYLLIHHILDRLQLLRRHGLEMGEVKAQPVRIHIRSLLLHMRAEHFLQRFLHQMRCRMVAGCRTARGRIHIKPDRIPGFQHALRDGPDVADPAAAQMDGILHPELTLRPGDDAGVAGLAAHGPVERGGVHNDRTLLAVRERLRHFTLRGQHADLRLFAQAVIAVKAGGDAAVDLIIDRSVRAHVVGRLPCRAGTLPLLLHAGIEGIRIHGNALLFQDLLRQVKRESVRIIQRERVFAVQDG